jgi:hypothetical protein
MRNAHTSLVGIVEGKKHFGDLGVDGSVTLKLISNE